MTTISPEMDILLDLIGRPLPEVAAQTGAPNRVCLDDVDPVRLVELAIHHGLACQLDSALDPRSPVRDRLRSPLALQQFRSLLAAGALQEMVRLCSAQGIEILAFKGPSLAMTVYGDLGARPFTDIDVLVRTERLKDAVALAESLGFAGPVGLDSIAGPARKHVSLSRGPVRLEIHDALFVDRDVLPFDDAWARSRPIAIGQFTLRTLGAADTLLHASLHGAGHAFLSLKWLADLAGLARVFPDSAFRDAVDQARAARRLPGFLCGWVLLEEFGVPLPPPVQALLRRKSTALKRLVDSCRHSWNPDSEGTPFGLTAHRLTMLPPLKRLRSASTTVFRPTPSDWRLIPWISPRIPLVFSLLRPFRIAFKYTLGHRHADTPVYHFDQ